MMSASQLSLVFQSALGAIILLTMFLILVPVLRLDIFRQKMFALRDELFDYAHDGNISFDHPAYRLLRSYMNGFIRYGHRLSPFQISMRFFQLRLSEERRDANEWQRKWDSAIESIEDEQVRKSLEQFRFRSMFLVTNRIVLGSPILLVATIIMTVVVLIGFIANRTWRSVSKAYSIGADNAIRAFKIDKGELENEALRSASLA
jgi:hypothetical protein